MGPTTQTSAKPPKFDIVQTTTGATSIRNNFLGEIMHNPIGPWKEANHLYVEQSQLKDRLKLKNASPLVVFDVGLGAGANALATLHCARQSGNPLHLISFEIDLELMRFALNHSAHFDFFSGFEEPLETLLREGCWQHENLLWQLQQGDFTEKIKEVDQAADLIFYDPYSAKVNSEMWTTACFKNLKAKCGPQAMFYNYSQATPVRAALLEAGFFVGYGISTGLKGATTQAACRLEDLAKPLDERWLERWQRSNSPYPYLCEDEATLKRTIVEHPQFSGYALHD